ncbi:MAG: cation:proton antiporter [Flavobacteriales bacterium]|jgi:NhaP-type Na+/H+ or K+/H+ antiporter|nr:cation:proton antiporter [Flavobacteriales bacterium]
MQLAFDYIKPEYLIIIGASLVIIFSFIFNFISIKTNIPSVLLLMALGVAIQYIYPELKSNPLISKTLIVVGKVGLILIVLEAALDLKLKKDKIGLIIKSFLMALFGLIGSSILIALAIQMFLESPFYDAFIYAVPLSIMSSAIIIPSVANLAEDKKEFMIYESTFSDILGIILFQFLISPEVFYSTSGVIFSITSNIVITIIVAVVFSYIAVWGIQKLTSHVKLFLIIAVLMLIYAIGSVFHLSSLIIILFFGLILNNTDIFFRSFLKNSINKTRIKPIFKEFYTITLESAFILRTFFFVTFGLTISLISLVNYQVAIQSLAIVGIIYFIRFIFLKILLWDKGIMPQLFIAPRGLITVLLFYTIPVKYTLVNFNQGILLYTILITSAVMTMALVMGKSKGKNISELLSDYDVLHDSIEKSLEDGHHIFDEENLDLSKTDNPNLKS